MTTDFKDHFSTQSSQYQRFRPCYPPALFDWLATQTPRRELAWDCATGNGQAALALAHHFEKVVASDASDKQVAQCLSHPRVEYRVAKAEQAPFADASVDLITVAQALHWFDQPAFFQEAWRVLREHGVLAVWTYNLLSISPPIDAIVNHYYRDIVGPYWPPERRLVEQGYPPLPVPFREISTPEFAMTSQWGLDDVLGYLGTWSASIYYAKAKQIDPLSEIRATLIEAWGQAEQQTVHWPLQIRVAIKNPGT